MSPEKRLKYIVTGCGMVVVMLHLLFAFWRVPTGWGVHCLAFFPGWVSVGSTALALLLLVPAVSGRAVQVISDLRVPEVHLPILQHRLARYALASLMFLIPFYLLRVRMPTLGDGPMLVRQLTQPLTSLSHEPLTIYLAHFVYRQMGGGGESDALRVYQVLSWSCGVLYVFVSLLISDAIGRDRQERTILRLFLLTIGTVQLFFGYVENYAPLTVAVLLYLYVAWRYLDGQGTLTAPVLVFGLAFCCHFSASVLFPSLAFLYYTRWQRNPSKVGLYLNLGILPALILSLLPLIGFGVIDYWQKIGTDPHTVPLWTPDPFIRPHTLLSPTHVVDVINHHLLVSPMGLLLISTILLTERNRIAQDPHLVLLGSAAFIFILFTAVVNPNLGAFRDWDLLSPVGVPVVLLSAYLLIRYVEPLIQPHLAWIVVVVSIFHLVPWLCVNADADRSVIRYGASLSDLSRLSTCAREWGYEELRGFYEKTGRKREALEAARVALQTNSQRPWLLMNVVRLMKETGDSKKAESLLKEILARDPRNLNALNYLANLYQDTGDLDRAIREYRRVLKSAPDYAYAHYNLGNVLKDKDDLDGAIHEYRQVVQINPRIGDVYYYLGLALAKKGGPADAIREFRNFLRLSADEGRKKNARNMIRELGGTP